MAKIMISYKEAPRDTEFARSLQSILEHAGHEVWQMSMVEPGENYVEIISREIDKADILILLASRRSLQSDWVLQEWTSMYARRRLTSDPPVIIPIKIENCDLPSLLNHKQVVELNTSSSLTLLGKLSELLATLKPFSDSPKTASMFHNQHTSAENDLIQFLGNVGHTKDNPKAVFFQYSCTEVKHLLECILDNGFDATVFIQDPARSKVGKQDIRISLSIDKLRIMQYRKGKTITVYQVLPPVTPKIVYVPNLFISLSYYVYHDSTLNGNANNPTAHASDPDRGKSEGGYQYDVEGHSNPVIIVQPKDGGWQFWEKFVLKLLEQYKTASNKVNL